MEHLTSASFPEGAKFGRAEADVRELVKAKLRAKAAYDMFCMGNAAKSMTEDEKIDRELESIRLCRALNAADDALFAATRA